MKFVRWVGVGLLSMAACTPSAKVVTQSSGSLGLTHDDATLYVADADHNRVTVIDTASLEVVGQVPVGALPERVLVGPDDTVYVSNKGSRSVMRIPPGARQAEAVGEVGAEPVGMALSADGQRLYVANSMSGTLSVLDALTLEKEDELAVGGQPWAVAVTPDGQKAFVTDFADGTVETVDLSSGKVTEKTSLVQQNLVECGQPASRTPAQAADVVVSPDGERAYVAHVQSRTSPGANGLAFAVAPALSTLGTSRLSLMQAPPSGPAVGPGEAPDAPATDFPPPVLSTDPWQGCAPGGRAGMDAPSSLVVDGSGEWLFVADHNSNAVAVVHAGHRQDERFSVPAQGIYDVVRVGARPTGLAVSGDLKTAYVHNALDYTVSVLANREHRLVQTSLVRFAASDLKEEVERGRRLFFSAVDERMTQPQLGGLSCSSCHPDGRSDNLTWHLPDPTAAGGLAGNSSLPSRNTPALWGVLETAPYHWDGVLADLPAFNTRMVQTMGGAGLGRQEVGELTAYLGTISPPDNPFRRLAADLSEGKALFEKGCASCHAGTTLTDGLRHGQAQLDTPSLRGVFATAPYLHDGSRSTLKAVLTGPKSAVGEHDLKGRLTEQQLSSLEEYLQAL